MRFFLAFFAVAVIAVIAMMNIRGRTFTSTPLEIFPDMKRQYKLKPQRENTFFADGRNERANPQGTVPTVPENLAGQVPQVYFADETFATGKNPDGSFVRGIPAPVTMEYLQEGRKKFEIYCTPCHGYVGHGNGVTQPLGMASTADLHQQRILDMAEGEIFNTVSNGKGQMLGYKNRMNTQERWQVVAYLRALQASQRVPMEALPAAAK